MPDYYPSIDDVEALHAYVMEQLGDPPERLTNRSALEGALHRPRNAAHYEGADLATQAALLITGIALAHAFPDGNKRTAEVVGDVFIQNNGYWLAARPLELARQIEAVVMHTITTHAFVEWIRERLGRLEDLDTSVSAGTVYEFTVDLTEETWGAQARDEWNGLTLEEKRMEFLATADASWDNPVTLRFENLREFNAARVFIIAQPRPGLYRCRAIARARVTNSRIGNTELPRRGGTS